jgi:ADP-ribosylglycohydrolase
MGFNSVLNELISIGGDADTIASMAGQVMGAYLGESELPRSELEWLPQRDEINRIIDRFAVTIAKAETYSR